MGAFFPLEDRVPTYLSHIKKPMVWVPYGRDAIGAVPKVGQTFIRRQAGNSQIPMGKVGCYDKRVVFLRDPLERLESAYNYFMFTLAGTSWPVCWDSNENRQRQINPQSLFEFIELVLWRYRDKHWAPQSDIWEAGLAQTDEKELKIYPFESFGSIMSRYGVKAPPENVSTGEKRGISHRVPELEDLYKVDLGLRERLLSDPTGIQVSQQELEGADRH